ncbi:hypothetical protein [Actinomadura parmotrematis]|uniref:Uncharacterized protein n=1 Tax=Actinomadura parmotrematis TaxID=2864039 RepID=A0ABS7FPC0_9ACTN|nr:hypothetical protein [Actinomadura parmotrematis]MBW8482233.1 hypothetical protein [Actinomadura parmotrematis]
MRATGTAAAVAACTAAAGAAAWSPTLFRAAIAAGAVAFAIGAVRAAREIHDRQVRILRGLDTQTAVLREAARAARDEPRR